VPQLAKVGAVVQQFVDHPLVDRPALANLAVLGGPGLRGDPVPFQLVEQGGARTEFDKALEDVPDELGLAFIRDQSPVIDVVAQRRHTAHP
jgi:hypothetical protein